MEEDMLFGPDLHLSTIPDCAASAFAADYEPSEAMVHLDHLFGHNLRLSTIPDPPASADERSEAKVRMDAAEKVILRLDSSIPGSLVGGFGGKYLSAVDDIILLAGDGVDDDDVGRAKSLLKTAMSRLGKEFGCIISSRSANLDADHRSFQSLSVSDHRSFQSLSVSMPSEISDLTSDDFTTEDFSTSIEEDLQAAEEKGWYYISDDHNSKRIPSKVISDIKEIADRMIAAGYQQELWHAYRSSSLDFLSGLFSVLEVDQSSIEHAQTIEWGALQDKVGKWIRRLNFIIRVFLPREKELCHQIFAASDELKEERFRKAAEYFVLQLLNLGEKIATVLPSRAQIFRILGIYDALSDVLPDIQALFSADSEQFLSKVAEQIVERLGKMARSALDDFEDAIRSKKLSRPRQSGSTHHLVKARMNDIKRLVSYSSSLNLLLHDDGVDGGDNSVADKSMFPFVQYMHLLVSYLECRIQKISGFYGDNALKYIFLMNNVQHMVQTLKNSELKILLGDNWVRTHHEQIQQYATGYLRASWSEALSYLKIDGLFRGGDSSNVSRVALKERFKNFNLAFEEILSTQTTWVVPDPQRRKDLRLLILMTVIPGYRSFVERFRPLLEGGQQPSKYIKYTPEDIENYLSDLFEGIPKTSKYPRRELGS